MAWNGRLSDPQVAEAHLCCLICVVCLFVRYGWLFCVCGCTATVLAAGVTCCRACSMLFSGCTRLHAFLVVILTAGCIPVPCTQLSLWRPSSSQAGICFHTAQTGLLQAHCCGCGGCRQQQFTFVWPVLLKYTQSWIVPQSGFACVAVPAAGCVVCANICNRGMLCVCGGTSQIHTLCTLHLPVQHSLLHNGLQAPAWTVMCAAAFCAGALSWCVCRCCVKLFNEGVVCTAGAVCLNNHTQASTSGAAWVVLNTNAHAPRSCNAAWCLLGQTACCCVCLTPWGRALFIIVPNTRSWKCFLSGLLGMFFRLASGEMMMSRHLLVFGVEMLCRGGWCRPEAAGRTSVSMFCVFPPQVHPRFCLLRGKVQEPFRQWRRLRLLLGLCTDARGLLDGAVAHTVGVVYTHRGN